MTEIHLDKVGKRIYLRTPYSPDVPELCKSVIGYKFDPRTKAWTYPLDWRTCLDIREKIANKLNRDIAFSEEMYAWATVEKQRQKELERRKPDPSGLGEAEIPNVQRRNPKIYAAAKSRPFQTVGIRFIADNGGAVLADDPGLGKTVQTLGAVEEAGLTGPILVVCNTSAQQVTWPNEIETWTDDEYLVFDKSIPADVRDDAIREVFEDCANDPGLRVWVLMNPYWVRMKADLDEYGKYVRTEKGVKIIRANVPAIFTSGEWAGVIADESHETLATNTGNQKKWSQQRLGLGAIPVRKDGLRISISGTPMRGKPENMFGQLNWVDPERYSSYWQWAKRHFYVSNDGYRGAMEIGELLDEEEFFKECANVMLRRSKSQVATDLPPKVYAGTPLDKDDPNSVVGIWLPMTPEQQKFYDELYKGEIFDPESMLTLNPIGQLAILTRFKQYATACGDLVEKDEPMFDKEQDVDGRWVYKIDPETDRRIPMYDENGNRMKEKVVTIEPKLPSNKWNWLVEWLDERDLLNGGKGKAKVIVASQFKGVIDLFRQELLEKYQCPSFHITGDTKIKERRHFQDEFQNNPDSPKVFFLQSVAGGTSLTLDQADDVIILDEMWDEGIQAQIEDRAHRLSRTDHTVTIWYLRSLGTVEEQIGSTVEGRRNVVRSIMDGQRGVDFRKLVKSE